ncbi:MAG TPA: 30S ribosomal protein S18 [Phycisphaerae bacterium]|nr:30S ribosomal protein S18 [Phycisphaerae bacterium]HRY67850.1 30S ribosomal protein S18 [Phycisphaerae bacterium]HSA25303.1 30S ribosomal protein S18 [Phycisphaerae bacterium]
MANDSQKKSGGRRQEKRRFADRGGEGWKGPIIDYKEVELLRKFMTASSKTMSRKRAGTSAREQRDLRRAIKRARFLALLPYTGT